MAFRRGQYAPILKGEHDQDETTAETPVRGWIHIQEKWLHTRREFRYIGGDAGERRCGMTADEIRAKIDNLPTNFLQPKLQAELMAETCAQLAETKEVFKEIQAEMQKPKP